MKIFTANIFHSDTTRDLSCVVGIVFVFDEVLVRLLASTQKLVKNGSHNSPGESLKWKLSRLSGDGLEGISSDRDQLTIPNLNKNI